MVNEKGKPCAHPGCGTIFKGAGKYCKDHRGQKWDSYRQAIKRGQHPKEPTDAPARRGRKANLPASPASGKAKIINNDSDTSIFAQGAMILQLVGMPSLTLSNNETSITITRILPDEPD